MFLTDSPPISSHIVDGIIFSPAVHNDRDVDQESKKRHRLHHRIASKSKTPKSYVDTVRKRVEIVNTDLIRKNSPYRYQIREKDNDLMLDMLIYTSDGNVPQAHTHRITADNYRLLLDKISTGEGFIFDD